MQVNSRLALIVSKTGTNPSLSNFLIAFFMLSKCYVFSQICKSPFFNRCCIALTKRARKRLYCMLRGSILVYWDWILGGVF
jgi:hypothetical protein